MLVQVYKKKLLFMNKKKPLFYVVLTSFTCENSKMTMNIKMHAS